MRTNSWFPCGGHFLPYTMPIKLDLGRKRKSLFPNTRGNNVKKQKGDNFLYIKKEIIDYINDDTSCNDSTRLILLNESNKYKALYKLAKKTLTVPATASPVERIFS